MNCPYYSYQTMGEDSEVYGHFSRCMQLKHVGTKTELSSKQQGTVITSKYKHGSLEQHTFDVGMWTSKSRIEEQDASNRYRDESVRNRNKEARMVICIVLVV